MMADLPPKFCTRPSRLSAVANMADMPVNGTAADDTIQQVDDDSSEVLQVSLNERSRSAVTLAFQRGRFGWRPGGFGVVLRTRSVGSVSFAQFESVLSQ